MKLDLIDTIPTDTPNFDLTLAALKLRQAMQLLDQHGLGHVLSGLRNSVQNNNPVIRAAIQSNVDEIMQAYAVVYYFSVWDHLFDQAASSDILDNWATKDEVKRFRAFKHIRHSAAHSFSGHRARQCRAAFENVMQSSQPFTGLNWNTQDDTIDLSKSQIAFDCRNFFNDFATKIAGRLMNNNRP